MPMPTVLKFRSAHRAALLVLVAVVAMLLPPGTAKAGPATRIALADVASTAVAGGASDGISISARDGDPGTIDTGYTGTVTFSAGCGDCIELSVNANMTPVLAQNKYTFVAGDNGAKALFLRWKANAADTTQTLHLSGTLAGGGTSEVDASNSTAVSSNAATKLDMTLVSADQQAGVGDPFKIQMRNAANATGATYTGTVTFSATCTPCFTVTPNDGTGNELKYTFKAGDNGTKNFTLTWLNQAASPPKRTFTATGSGSLPQGQSDTQTNITVHAAATTTTSSTSTTSTTSTTTTTVPTTTTSTTIVPRTKTAMFVTGAGPGGGPHVITRKASDGTVLHSFYAYGATFNGGVRVATGDVNGDGYDDIITAPGPGGGPHVRVFNGKDAGPTPSVLTEFMAYGAFTGGVFVAAADVNNDGKADIITGPDAGGGPHVRVWNGATGSTTTGPEELFGLMAYATSFTGGVRVAGGDFNNDGKADIVTGAGAGGGPHVRVISSDGTTQLGSFFAYAPAFTGGVYVAADPEDDAVIFTGAGIGGGRHVRLLDLDGEEVIDGFIVAGGGTNGAIPAVGNSSNEASPYFLVSRAAGNAEVQRLSFEDGHVISTFPAYGAAQLGVFTAIGVF